MRKLTEETMTVHLLLKMYDDDGNPCEAVVEVFADEVLASRALEELCPDGDDYEYEIVEREVITSWSQMIQ